MTTFPINVVIDPSRASSGARQVERQLGRIENRANRVGSAIRRALGFIGGVAAISGLIRLADSFNVLQNRLRIVEKDQTQVNKRFKELLAISQRVRQPLGAIVQLFQRGSIAADELKVSSEQLLVFVERVGKGLAIQGSNAAESRGALIQLSQALGSGIVRGEEFNAILEGAFPIAQAAARGFTETGISVAKLRRLVIDGKVSSIEFFDAFIKGSEDFDRTFGKTVPTISQSLTVFNNALINFVGEVDKANGITAKLSKAIILASKNIDLLAKGLIGISVTLGVLYVGAVINAARATLVFTLALVRNPFGLIAVALASLIGLFVSFGDKIKIAGGEVTTIKDVVDVTFDSVEKSVTSSLEGVTKSINSTIKKITDFGKEIDLTFKSAILSIAKWADSAVSFFRGFVSALAAIPGLAEGVFLNPLKRLFNNTLVLIENFINSIIDDLNQIPGVNIANILIPVDELQVKETGLDIGETLALAYLNGLKGAGILDKTIKLLGLADLKAAAREAGAGVAREGFLGPDTTKSPTTKAFEEDPKNQFVLSKIIPDLIKVNELLSGRNGLDQKNLVILGLSNNELAVREALIARAAELSTKEEPVTVRDLEVGGKLRGSGIVVENLIKQNLALTTQQDLLESIQGPRQDAIFQLEQLNSLFQGGVISTDEFTRAQRDLQIQALETSTSFEDGLLRGLLKIEEELTNFASLAENNLTQAFSTLQSSLVSFLKTGEFSFKSFFESILTQLANLFIQLTVILPLANALKTTLTGGGGGGGGFLSGIGGLLGGLFGGGGGGAAAAGPLFGPGFEHGGRFLVGGSGGTDSQRVNFRASPNEEVTIRTPAQQRRDSRGGDGDTIINLKMEVGITPTVQAEILNLMPFIKAEVSQAVLDGRDRGGSLWEAFD